MNAFSSTTSSTEHELYGQLIHPPGFERLLAVLTYIPLDEYASSKQLHHLVKMTVTVPEALWQYQSSYECFSTESVSDKNFGADTTLVHR